jgi:hypothetical protein
LAKCGADALDQPGGEIALDALARGGRGHLQEQGAELSPVIAMLLPMTTGLDVLAGVDLRGAAQHGDEVAPAPHLHPKHAEAALGAMEGDALDQPRKGLAFLRLAGWLPHANGSKPRRLA